MKDIAILGAIAGDIAGSTIEGTYPELQPDFFTQLECGHFTDDTVMTIAVLDFLRSNKNLESTVRMWGEKYHHNGFSKGFINNFLDATERRPIHGSTNGALMQLSPFAYYKEDDRQIKLTKVVKLRHDSSEALACAHDYLKTLDDPYRDVKNFSCVSPFWADFETLKNERHWDMSSIITLRNAYVCLHNSKSYEDVLNKVLYLGGDADTVGTVAGSIAAVKYGLPSGVEELIRKKLPGEMWELFN